MTSPGGEGGPPRPGFPPGPGMMGAPGMMMRPMPPPQGVAPGMQGNHRPVTPTMSVPGSMAGAPGMAGGAPGQVQQARKNTPSPVGGSPSKAPLSTDADKANKPRSLAAMAAQNARQQNQKASFIRLMDALSKMFPKHSK